MNKFKAAIMDLLIIGLILAVAVFLVAYDHFTWRELVILFLTIYVVNCLLVFYMLLKDDELHEKFIWVFFLVVFPILAHIIFALFRIRRNPGISRLDYENRLFALGPPLAVPQPDGALSDFESEQNRLINRQFYWTNVQLFVHGFEAYEDLFADLERAQKYIHIEMYIIKKSETFERFKQVLITKAQSGVEVKIILDSFGTWLVRQREFEYLQSNKVEIVIFNKTFYPIVKPTDNNRLHRKFFVIDGQIVHSGGLNISDEYSSYSHHYGYWADLNFKLQGPIVNDYERMFWYDWYQSRPNNGADLSRYWWQPGVNSVLTPARERVLLFDEGPNNYENLLENTLINWIYNTKTTIRLSTPYFIPTKQIFNALKSALKKGVDLEIYIPGKPDKKIIYYGTFFYLKQLIHAGAKVYVMNEIFLHSKFAVFDDQFAYIGTNNLDMRSLYTNYEIINIICGAQTIQQMNAIFDQYQRHAQQLHDWHEGKLKTNFKKIIYELFAPLM